MDAQVYGSLPATCRPPLLCRLKFSEAGRSRALGDMVSRSCLFAVERKVMRGGLIVAAAVAAIFLVPGALAQKSKETPAPRPAAAPQTAVPQIRDQRADPPRLEDPKIAIGGFGYLNT